MVHEGPRTHRIHRVHDRPSHVQLLQRVHGTGFAGFPSPSAAPAGRAERVPWPAQGSGHVHDVWQHQGGEIRPWAHHQACDHVPHRSW